MSKTKVAFVCNSCGAEFSKWQGQCTECGEWNTISEFRIPKDPPVVSGSITSRSQDRLGFAGSLTSKIQKLSEITTQQQYRFSTTFREFDRVLGGGIIPGGAMIVGGHPGAGKSTLLLQTMCRLSQNYNVLYVTGEESLQQVALRAQRLQLPVDKLNVVSETSIENICAFIENLKPQIVVIDSIQVMHLDDISSAPGSVSQVRECAAVLTRVAKTKEIACFLVGHVTKDGALAGPKVLEHCVDCSILLEGDSDSRYRTLRCLKNRFGAVNEIGVFAMTGTGMKEVSNPSAIFLNRSQEISSGSCVMAIWEGTRPMLVELQALADTTKSANPRRLTVGTDSSRLAMLLAVLHRHAGVSMNDQDVFINVVGGVKVDETSADLPLLAALVSSYRDHPIARDMISFGEVGLSGEIRPMPSGLERLAEAAKHGFKKAVIPKDNAPSASHPIPGMEIIPVTRISQLVDLI